MDGVEKDKGKSKVKALDIQGVIYAHLHLKSYRCKNLALSYIHLILCFKGT